MPRKIGNLILYSVDDLHKMLGVSKMTIRTYLREGKLKGRKLGVKWFITEESLRDYFENPEESPEKKRVSDSVGIGFRFVVQGVNDLVSETEECDSVEETVECIKSQAIISLFQVAIVDRKTDEIVETIKARDFLDRYE